MNKPVTSAPPLDPLDVLLEDLVLQPNALFPRGFPAVAAAGHVTTPSRPGGPRLLALDCEMCLSTGGPEVVRVTLVGEDGDVRLDLKVLPSLPVLDWQTEFSGIGPGDLAGVTTTLADAQRAVCDLIDDRCILVGHALQNDARALRLVHGRYVDTHDLYAQGRGASQGASLKYLARRHLGRAIQTGHHDSAQDARAALDLVRHRAAAVLPTRDISAPPAASPPAPAPGAPLDLASLLARLRLAPGRIRNVYQFGSRVYGTSTEQSDWDFILISDLETEVEEHLARGDVNAAIYDRGTFERLLENASVWALECMFLPPSMVWKEELDLRPAIRLDPATLRESVCAEAGFAWNKARRIFLKEHDPYRGKKNLFHSFRFLHYGAQLAREGRIVDYGAANHHLAAMRALPGGDWNAHRAAFQGEHRTLRHAFTRLVPFVSRHLRAGAAAASVADAGAPEAPPPALLPDPGAPLTSSLAAARYLHEHGLDALTRDHGIEARRHPEFPSLIHLSYTHEAPRGSPVAAECRGLILDAADGLRPVAYPYGRFFNVGEPQAAPIDWPTARVFEKLDGSLATLYWYQGLWHVASRKNPDGGGRMCWYSQEEPITFAELFWGLWRGLGYRLPPAPGPGSPRRCYLFELVTNRHQIVVRHDAEALVLHGARDLDTLEELDPIALAADHGWQAPRVVEGPRSFDEVQALADALNPLRAEGFVVCDGAFRRVKVKSPGYVRLSMAIHGGGRARGLALSTRRMLDLIRSGATGEFLAYFPEQAPQFRRTEASWGALLRHAHDAYAALAPLATADFGREVNRLRQVDRSLPRLFFSMRRGLTAAAALRSMQIENVERLLQKFNP